MPVPLVTAVDIDLNRFTTANSQGGIHAHSAPWTEVRNVFPRAAPDGVVLIEVAGPVMHHKESHSHRRWMIFNVAAAVELAHIVGLDRARFSTSTVWTRGYSEEQRHALAGIFPYKRKVTRGKSIPVYADPHDVRECQCMLYMFSVNPKAWVTLPDLLASMV